MKMLFPKSVISYSYILDQYLSLKQSSQMCWFPWLCFLVLPNTSFQCFLNHPLPLHSLNTHEQHPSGPCGHTLFTCRPSPEEIIFRQSSNSSTRDLSFYAKLQFLISSSRHDCKPSLAKTDLVLLTQCVGLQSHCFFGLASASNAPAALGPIFLMARMQQSLEKLFFHLKIWVLHEISFGLLLCWGCGSEDEGIKVWYSLRLQKNFQNVCLFIHVYVNVYLLSMVITKAFIWGRNMRLTQKPSCLSPCSMYLFISWSTV